MLDNIRIAEVEAAWRQALGRKSAGDIAGAAAVLNQADCLDGSEEGRKMRAILQAEVESAHPPRLTPLGLTELDVIEYLPVRDFVEDAETWAALRAEHAAELASRGSNGVPKNISRDFKAWLGDRRKSAVHVEAIAASARNVDHIHPDFVRLLKTVQARLSTASGPRDLSAT